MILFNTTNIETYNYIIHHFLQLKIFKGLETIDGIDDMDIGDQIEDLLPKYLFREQYKNALIFIDNYFTGLQTIFIIKWRLSINWLYINLSIIWQI